MAYDTYLCRLYNQNIWVPLQYLGKYQAIKFPNVSLSEKTGKKVVTVDSTRQVSPTIKVFIKVRNACKSED